MVAGYVHSNDNKFNLSYHVMYFALRLLVGKGSLMGEFMPLNPRLDGRGGKLQVTYSLLSTIQTKLSAL